MNTADATYESQLRDAIDAKCRELDYNLLAVYGRALDEPSPASTAHNAVFDLVGRESVDGLIVISSCLSSYTGAAGVERLLQRYRPLPLCSIGLGIPGVPSVVSDNRTGVDAAVEHLITVHGCRRPAFLAGTPGNPESQARFDAYRDVLERHQISVDPALVVPGHFRKDSARAAIAELVERGTHVDAIVAANDAMAAGAIEAMRSAGRRVPRDLAVTGFDDLQFARVGNPPLTTVRQPIQLIAEAAFQVLLAQMGGGPVPQLVSVPCEFIVRQSCGCDMRMPETKSQPAGVSGLSAAQYLIEHGDRIRGVLVGHFGAAARGATTHATRLTAALQAELAGEREAFVRAVEAIIDDANNDGEFCRSMQFALTALRAEMRGVGSRDLDWLWYDALAVVALASTTGHALHRMAFDHSYFQVVGAGEQAAGALDLASLEKVLARNLPDLGVESAFVSQYVEPGADEFASVLCVLDGESFPAPVVRYPARLILPPGAYPPERRHTSLVIPLAFETQLLGVAVFEYTSPLGYNILAGQIAAALHNVALHREILHKTMLHERDALERVATAQRLQALSVLAGGVAHDLNNSLGPLVALPDVILAELQQLQLTDPAVQDVCADLETIRTASLRAAQTVKDLLTLGRQGRVAKTPVDLNRVVQACLGPGQLRFLQGGHLETEIAVELGAGSIVVQGAEAHLARAVTNLVHNALEALDGSGRVLVRTSRRQLSETLLGYETVDPGDYAVITVSDDGKGIPGAELGRIFEPFFSKKRTGDRSGTGLGLAIVHGVAKEHDGYVDVTSTPGRGTTFTLYIPLAGEPARASWRVPSLRPGNARILVVDDEPIQLRTARRILTRLGYQVDTVSSGREAIQLIGLTDASRPSAYDLVILDVLLNEDLDGLEVYELIRKRFADQKGIVVSGNASTERLERAIRSGLVWLAKPYTSDALAGAVQTALGQECAARS